MNSGTCLSFFFFHPTTHHLPQGTAKDPFSSTASLDVNPFDDPFADQDSVNKPSQYSHEPAASRAADLARREQDLERRERELQQKAENIRKHGRNNWPPCKSLLCLSRTFHGHAHLALVFPLIYHDISEEIPEASRPLISRLYLLWLVLAGTLIVNMVACIFVLTSGGSDGAKDLIVSIMCVPSSDCGLLIASPSFLDSITPLISVLSFLLWYR
jgi:secretory carrier-associated membrane protein